MAQETEDEELAAIKTVLGALTPLKPEARNNVIDYVFRRLRITAPATAAFPQPEEPRRLASVGAVEPALQHVPQGTPTDLRSLTQEKQPKSANQMVAILAYYLANLAPPDQRRDHVVAEDIKKYFPQANFPLPTGPHNMTLVNAKNAGYLDMLSGGQYRLNPVGHNLVVHKLPRVEGSAPIRRTRRGNKSTRKPVKKTARK